MFEYSSEGKSLGETHKSVPLLSSSNHTVGQPKSNMLLTEGSGSGGTEDKRFGSQVTQQQVRGRVRA